LIEMMAVVLIIAFMSAMVLPGLRSTSNSARHDEALNVAVHLELARQRAIMTGKPHRVLIDVDAGAYHIEWLVSNQDDGMSRGARRRAILAGEIETSLLAPPTSPRGFQPIPGKFGKTSRLEDPFYFDGIDTPEGWLDSGDVGIEFDRDGTTENADIVITDPDGFAATLEIFPLLDTVRIRHETQVN
jgi:type II secretory pathway pseudopilin PulG